VIQEGAALALAEYMMSDVRLPAVTITQLKNLVFYIHQNFLLLCDFIYRKLPPETAKNVSRDLDIP
jgi:hypothetical protein